MCAVQKNPVRAEDAHFSPSTLFPRCRPVGQYARRRSALSPRLGDEDSSALRETDPRFSTNLLKTYKSSLTFGVRCESLDSQTCRAAASVISTFIFTHKDWAGSAHGASFRIKKKNTLRLLL